MATTAAFDRGSSRSATSIEFILLQSVQGDSIGGGTSNDEADNDDFAGDDDCLGHTTSGENRNSTDKDRDH
jgi:hypothetical protein